MEILLLHRGKYDDWRQHHQHIFKKVQKQAQHTVQNEDAVDIIHNKKSIRTCWMSCATGLQSAVWHKMHANKYKYKRTTICSPPSGCYTRLWTGKPVFTRSAVMPNTICNAPAAHHSSFQQRLDVNTCAVIVYDLYNQKVCNTELSMWSLLCLSSSANTSLLSEDVSSHVHESMCFQHDHALACFACQVCNSLEHNLLDRQIGCGGLITWLPYLTSLQVSLWERLKEEVHGIAARDRDDPINCTEVPIQEPGYLQGLNFRLLLTRVFMKTEGTSAAMYIHSTRIHKSPPHRKNVFKRGTLKCEVRILQKDRICCHCFFNLKQSTDILY
jgi:hypothetical protein